MRTVLLLSLAACFPTPEDEPQRPYYPPKHPDAGLPPPSPQPPPPDAPPVPVQLGDPQRFAAGTSHVVQLPEYDLTTVDLTSSDPSILTAEVVDYTHLRLISHRAGVATLEGRRHDSSLVDTLEVTAVPIAAMDVMLGALPPSPPASAFAALPGAADAVCVTYFTAGGEALPGAGAFVSSGAPVVVDKVEETDLVPQPSACAEIRFGVSGSANLVASLEHGISRTLPIQIVPAAATAEVRVLVDRGGALVPAPDPVDRGVLMIASFIARTADGRPVAGMRPTWTVTTPPAAPFIDSPPLLIFSMNPGTATLTGTAGALSASRTITASP